MIMASNLIKELEKQIREHGDAPVTIEVGGDTWDTRDVRTGYVTGKAVVLGRIGENNRYTLFPDIECSL